jgi:transposase InsO family protein
MEAIPLSDTSVAACAKALTITWISRFGVPETITSDRGPQFTSNLWFKLCEMLHISHKQTTVYHPESNGAVFRLHRLSRTPFAHAPPRRLGLRSYLLCSSDSEHSRGKTLVFPLLRQFLALPLCCLMNFCKNKEMSVDAIIKNFSKTLHVPAVSLPRHNSSAQLPDKLPGNLLSVPLVWVCRGSAIPPLQPLYDSPYAVLRRGPAPSQSESGPETRSSPSVASRPARPRTPCLAVRVAMADRRVRAQVVLPQPRGSRFQTRWFLHLPLQRRHKTVPEPFSYPARRFLHARDWRRHHRCHKRSTRPVNGHRHRGWTSDLFSSRPRPELGGSPVDTCLHPW